MASESVLGLVPLAVVAGGVVWWLSRRRAPAVAVDGAAAVGSSLAGRFERLCWAVTALVGCYGLLTMVDASVRTDLSAPQFAAIASGVCAKVLVAYVFTRAVQGWRRSAP